MPPIPFRLRFGLRSLAAAIVIAALGSYWLARPSILADRFVHAMEAGDYAVMERLFSEHGEVRRPRTALRH